jgi:predicted enzyme related to lactoylglutathione lyase
MGFNSTVTHIEIPAPDIDKAINFYSKVFGWQKTAAFSENYILFRIGDTNSGGAFDPTLKPAAEGVGPQLVINVESVDDTIGLLKAENCKITKEKTEIPGRHGFYACFIDPNGNYMQIHSEK